MAKQIQASPSNKKISEIYQRIKEGSLVLQPEFQRKLVWNTEHKENFIDTILKGLPFPEIYVAQSGVDIVSIASEEVVVDGQQRLSTIIQYIDGVQENNKPIFGKHVKSYADLKEDEQKDFLKYNVVVRDLGDVTSDQIKEIFKRMNQTKYSLESIEIHNAVYAGEFISTAKEILQSIEGAHLPIFSDSEITRMSDLHFIILCMATFENGGYFPYDKEVEKFIVTFDSLYDKKAEIKDIILSVLFTVHELSLPFDSIWFRKSNFFTMICQLLFSGNKIDRVVLRDKLLAFEKEIIQNKGEDPQTNDYAKYYSYMFTGTNSRQARVVRAQLFDKNILL